VRVLLAIGLVIGIVAVLNVAKAADGQDPLHGLDRGLQAIKQEAVDINQELLDLEEAVLYPPDQQLVVFVSLPAESRFRPETVQVTLNGDEIAERTYTHEEGVALRNGGVHRLHMGRLPDGAHTLVVSVAGLSETGQPYRREISATIVKGLGPKYVELGIQPAGKDEAPKLTIEAW
jgi:hypothetical protein